MNRTLLVAMLAVCTMLMAPAASAADVVGASGQCFDEDGSGGDAHLAVTEDGDVEERGLTDVSEEDPTPSAVDAVLALGNDDGNPEEGDACTDADDDTEDEDGTAGKDYIEVHAAGNQVCYDGSVQTESGSCPTRAD